MSNELFCPDHGPYDASHGSCPFCAQEGGRPPAPSPLDEDDLPTEIPGAGPASAAPGYRYAEDDVTAPPGSRRGGFLDYDDDEDETVLPSRRRRGRLLDDDDDEDVTVIDREDTSLLGWLIVKQSPFMRRGHITKIKPGAIWGRNKRKADVMLDDDKVSGLHARIQVKEEQFILLDLGSVNGTWVNGEELAGPHVLQENDEVKIGDTVFVVKMLV